MDLDLYDYLAFLTWFLLIGGFTALFVWAITLPGKLAIRRKHPHAESVRLMGNLGFLGVVPWVHALIWAFHDSWTVDIRRLPKQEAEHVEMEIARLKGDPPSSGSKPPEPSAGSPEAERPS